LHALRAYPRGSADRDGERPLREDHLFCEHCGSAFYSRKSENKKGVYVYYQCGCRQRRGPEACPNTITQREDKLLAGLREVCSAVFIDIDAMAEAAVQEAQQAAQAIGWKRSGCGASCSRWIGS
jgi:hypothetical protein